MRLDSGLPLNVQRETKFRPYCEQQYNNGLVYNQQQRCELIQQCIVFPLAPHFSGLFQQLPIFTSRKMNVRIIRTKILSNKQVKPRLRIGILGIGCYQKLQVLTGDRFSISQQQIPSIPILKAKPFLLNVLRQHISKKIRFYECTVSKLQSFKSVFETKELY